MINGQTPLGFAAPMPQMRTGTILPPLSPSLFPGHEQRGIGPVSDRLQSKVGPGSQNTDSAHPCQSGAPCECKGQCLNKNETLKSSLSSINPAASSQSTSYYDSGLAKMRPLGASWEPVQTGIGGFFSFIASFGTPSAEVVSIFEDKDEILINISRIADSHIMFEASIERSLFLQGTQSLVPRETLLTWVGLSAFGMLLAQRSLVTKIGLTLDFDQLSKRLQIVEPMNASPPSPAGGIPRHAAGVEVKGSPNSHPRQESDCIPHDLVCSFPGMEPDKKHMNLFLIPLGRNVRVDFSDCCFNHDIGWWCSYLPGDVSAANTRLANCVSAKINQAFFDACGGGFWCTFFAAFESAVLDVISGSLLKFSLDIGAGIVNIVDWIDKILGKDHPKYFDTTGSHQRSCLCGGNEVTFKCGDPCRNVCLESSLPITDDPYCFKCYYDCKYLPGGIPDPNSPLITKGAPCCIGSPGSQSRNGVPCGGTVKSSCCSKDCYPCKWRLNCFNYLMDQEPKWEWITDPGGCRECCTSPENSIKSKQELEGCLRTHVR